MINKIAELKALAKNYKLLYVEDNDSIRRSMEQYLRKFFLEVVVATNGKEGLECYENGSFELVVTDLSMPIMNGLEMLEAIKKIHPEQLVLVTSAHSESEYMIGAIELGIDGYIIKPFDFEQLNSELFKIVEKIHIYEENAEYKKSLERLVEKKTKMLNEMLSFQSENYEKTIYSMVEMIEERDTYTAGHSKRVAKYSKLIAQSMGYSEAECIKIHQAGILHDIGKIATPDSVLLNPKALNTLEYKLIQEHVNVGYKLISHVPMFAELAEIIYAHHERYDGSGYPQGLKGDEILPLSRIMIVADSFDAMTTSRIYKARKSVQEAIAELNVLSGFQYDPQVVKYASIALKDVVTEEGINQLPKSELEEERFAYFYKDMLSESYNQNYLEIVLVKNAYEKKYAYMYTVFLKNFSKFNKTKSWSEGDVLLKKVSHILKDSFSEALIFRVFGDDFVVISEQEQDTSHARVLLDEVMSKNGIHYKFKSIDLREVDIENIKQIENS